MARAIGGAGDVRRDAPDERAARQHYFLAAMPSILTFCHRHDVRRGALTAEYVRRYRRACGGCRVIVSNIAVGRCR